MNESYQNSRISASIFENTATYKFHNQNQAKEKQNLKNVLKYYLQDYLDTEKHLKFKGQSHSPTKKVKFSDLKS